MSKIKVRKDVAEQMTSKLKTLKNENIKPEFAEKLQKSALNSQNEQMTSKLQANKNLFHRGQFDAYKIKNMGVAPDGCVYDLDNPTEKFYYDLKMKFAENDKADDIEKTLFSDDWDEILKSHKYSRKEYKNGKWIYYYDKNNNYGRITRCNEPKLNILVDKRLDSETQSVMIADQAIDYIENVWLKDWEQHPEKAICKELRGKKIYFSDVSYEHIWKQGGNTDSGSKLREPSNILSHVKYLPMAKEIIESNGVWTNARYEKLNKPFLDKENNKVVDAVIYQTLTGLNSDTNSKYPYVNVKITRRKYKDGSYDNDVYISVDAERKIKKSMDFSPCSIISKSVNDKASSIGLVRKPKCHANNLNITQQNNLSSKNVIKSLTISDRLFRLWQRRLSPELQKEMQKYVDEHSRVYSLFSGYKDVYEIKGYPKGLDLENNILLELGDTYFVVSCGGDWQDEKLVKFSIGEDDKLKAEVVDKCDKEDKRVLNKKLAYIINPTEINKSLTYSGHKLQGRTRLYGMDISIENKKGSYRSGVDKDGHEWKVLMHYDYGYIRGTVGVDGDHEDCYIGPDKNAEKVYVIHQNDPVTHKYDEDKCMLCFNSAADAKAAYMKQYDRPGFYGSMTIMTIDEFKSFIFSHKGKMVHKSFDINITDITENNKQQKLEQVNKALNAIADNRPFMIKHIPADSSTNYGNLLVRITDFDRSKIEKAVHKIALSLDADISGASKGETFVYKAQEELVDKYFKEFTNRTRAIYNFVIGYFDLPDIRIVSKAGELKYKGKVLYNPETGLPIKESEWKKFIVELEKFLNRNYTGIGEKIVLSAESLGIILDRLSKTNSLDAIRKMSVADLKAKRYDVDWIGDSVKNMKDKFGEVISRERQARIQIAMDSAAQRVTKVKDDMRNNIQQIVIDGIREKQSKSVVAQNLFDKCASLNRDMQRIADTEVQMATSRAYIKEEVYNTPENEKVYFKRFEMLDDNTCKKCRKINGKIVLWSDVALPDEHIKDEYADIAIWEGKTEGDYPESVLHPWCRGAWIRYYPEV